MAKKSLNMIEKMIDPNIIDYYIINCAIPSIITIENRYQIDFGKPVHINSFLKIDIDNKFSMSVEIVLKLCR